MDTTQEHASTSSKLHLRGYHPLWPFFPEKFDFPRENKKQSKHHISFVFQQRIQFALSCFQSLLLTTSLLISFPLGTKTFQFPRFPILTDLKRKSYSDISGSKCTCHSPEHFVACHALHHHFKPSHPSNSVRNL